MNEQQFFDQLNEKTAANHRKYQAEKARVQRLATAVRRRNRLIALDLCLAAVALMALGVLFGCAVG